MTKNSRGPTGRQARGAPVFPAVAGLAPTRLTVLSEITELAYAPDSATAATGGGEDGTVRIWDTRTGQ